MLGACQVSIRYGYLSKKGGLSDTQSFVKIIYIARGGAVVACRAHNPKVAGSSPAPATNIS